MFYVVVLAIDLRALQEPAHLIESLKGLVFARRDDERERAVTIGLAPIERRVKSLPCDRGALARLPAAIEELPLSLRSESRRLPRVGHECQSLARKGDGIDRVAEIRGK